MEAANYSETVNYILSTAKANEKEQAAIARELLNKLETSTLAEHNRKTALQIYCQSVIEDGFLSEEDQRRIFEIANQCIDEGGSGIIIARALYQSYKATVFDDEKLCPGTKEILFKQIKNNTNHSVFSIVPNPAMDYATIVLSDVVKEANVNLVIYSTTGNVLYKQQLNAFEKNRHTISLDNFKSGIYFCHLISNDGSISIKKLIIQK